MSKTISILLGAGFSKPIGYPIGNELNDELLNCNDQNMAFTPDGRLLVFKPGYSPEGMKTSYDIEFDFCRDLMLYFKSIRRYFNYQEFYDFFNFYAKEDMTLRELFKKNNYPNLDFDQALFATKNIFQQLVNHFICDKNSEKWYPDDKYWYSQIYLNIVEY